MLSPVKDIDDQEAARRPCRRLPTTSITDLARTRSRFASLRLPGSFEHVNANGLLATPAAAVYVLSHMQQNIFKDCRSGTLTQALKTAIG
jgi:hypothetical protein